MNYYRAIWLYRITRAALALVIIFTALAGICLWSGDPYTAKTLSEAALACGFVMWASNSIHWGLAE